jgi:hypothetical protein
MDLTVEDEWIIWSICYDLNMLLMIPQNPSLYELN